MPKRKRTPYRVGYEFEKLVKKKLEAAGFRVMDSRGSKGIIDMVAWRWRWHGCVGAHDVWLIQCKKHGIMSPADRATLCSMANTDHATPVLAEGVRPTHFWRICEGTTKEALVLS